MTSRVEEDSFEIEGPMGTHARARGPGAMLALLIVTGFAGMVALWWVHHNQMLTDHDLVKQEFNEMVYVLSLPEEERAKLRLAMPESLRHKVRRAHEETQ